MLNHPQTSLTSVALAYLLSPSLLEGSHSKFSAGIEVGGWVLGNPMPRETTDEDNLAVVNPILLKK